MFKSRNNTSSTSLASTATVSSKSPLTRQPNARPQPQKDYASAFASLQSVFGFSGNAPMRPPLPTTSQSSQGRIINDSHESIPSSSISGMKDFEASFGALSSSYGFGGVPYAPPAKKPSHPQ